MTEQVIAAATTEVAALTPAELKANIYTSDSADNLYQRLRVNIRNRFQKLMEGDVPPLVELSAPTHGLVIDLFLNQLDAESRQHYNCNCCTEFFEQAGRIGVVGEDLMITSPLQEALAEEVPDYVVVPQRYIAPLKSVNIELTVEKKNGFFHFYAFSIDELNHLNGLLNGIDTNFVDEWVRTLKCPIMTPEAMGKIHAHLKEHLYNSAPVSLLYPLIKLLDDRKALPNGSPFKSSFNLIAALYRFPRYDWLSGVKSSSAGNVLTFLERTYAGQIDNSVEVKTMKELIGQLNYQTDPARHKRAEREASEQALRRDLEKLATLNVHRALERALVAPSDLEFVWEQAVDVTAAKEEVEDSQEKSAAARAMDSIFKNREEKKPAAKATNSLDEQMESNPSVRQISLKKFRETLSEFTHITLAGHPGSRFYPIFLTKPVDDADYSAIFEGGADAIMARMPVNPITLQDCANSQQYWDQYTKNRVALNAPIESIYMHANEQLVMRTDLPRPYLEQLMKNNGTMVLGTDILSSLKDHSRGWTELSKNMEVVHPEEPFFTGISLSLGMVLKCRTVEGVNCIVQIMTKE